MEFTRRSAIVMGAGAFAALFLPKLAVAAAGDDAIAAFTGGAEMADTGVTLTAPEIAENGNTVPRRPWRLSSSVRLPRHSTHPHAFVWPAHKM